MILKLFFLLGLSCGVQAYEPPPLTGPVIDQAQIIDTRDEQYLEQLIRQINAEGRAQLQILTVPSLNGAVLEQATIDTVDKYQLGDKAKDNGLLIFVARDERKVRIEVGQGLEGNIPDLLAHRIIEYKIAPQFREGQFGRGLIAAVGSIESFLDPQKPKEQFTNKPKSEGRVLFLIFAAIFILSLLSSLFGRRRGLRSGGAFPFIIGGLGGGSGRGGFGGGGWSGGGGGFSGGGSSGGW